MPTYVSPGVYVVEKDISQYPAAINPSVVGIVGFAERGPVDKATLITNGERLIATFGEPKEAIIGQGLEGALEVLETTNSLYFVRCASTSAIDASAVIGLGACPMVTVSGNIGVGASATIIYNVYDNLGVKQFSTDKTVAISAGHANTVDALSSLGGAITDASKLSVHAHPLADGAGSAVIVGGFAGSGASLFLSATGGMHIDGTFFGQKNNGDTSGAAVSGGFFGGTSFDKTGTTSIAYLIQSLYPGAGYNYKQSATGVIKGLTTDITTGGGSRVSVNINDNGNTEETFVVEFADGDYYIEEQINTGEEGATSTLIKANIVSGTNLTDITLGQDDIVFSSNFGSIVGGGANITGVRGSTVSGTTKPAATTGTLAITDSSRFRFVKLVQENGVQFAGGTNGIPEATDSDNINDILVGESTATGKTGMQVLDNDLLNLSMAAVPGITNQAVQNALITLAESTQEFLAVVAPPYAIGGAQAAIDWSNGLDETRTAAINSSYAAIYWPWVKVFSQFDGVDRWYDPSIFALRQMAYTDAVSESWFAPAGFVRGRLTKPTEVEIGLGQGDRDAMYSGGNVINPIVNFPQQGITIFGQRTAQRNPSALDRINVRRMMLIIRKTILASTRQFAFEPNDPLTWTSIRDLTVGLLDPILKGRGISEFSVVCDETTNTPTRIERGELWCKVSIRPTKTAEIIVFELNIVNQSASI